MARLLMCLIGIVALVGVVAAGPLGKPSEPPGKPTHPPGKPTRPPGKPTHPRGKPTRPPGKPTRPPGKPSDPPGKPAKPSRPPGKPTTNPPSKPGTVVRPPDTPTNPPGKPTGSPGTGAKLAPETPVPLPPGTHHVCVSVGNIFYEIVADATGTILKRFDELVFPRALLSASSFAPLTATQPRPNAAWVPGVDYAAQMQKQNVWPVPLPSSTIFAFWDALGPSDDVWRFTAVVKGVPTETVFSTQLCSVPQTPVPPPAPTPPPVTHHVCLSAGNVFYEIFANDTDTVLKRFDELVFPRALLSSSSFASLTATQPAPSAAWVPGVDYAAQMQKQNVWPVPLPSTTIFAFWDALGPSDDVWRFTAVVRGVPTETVFSTQLCSASDSDSASGDASDAGAPPVELSAGGESVQLMARLNAMAALLDPQVYPRELM